MSFFLIGSITFGQNQQPARVADQEHWITNDQLLSVLSLDFQVEAQQGWLIVEDGANRFFVQANQLFPELRMMQAWGNTVSVTTDEINELNNQLFGGRLFITPENKIQLVYEHSYHGMRMNTIGLAQSIDRFREVRDAVVKMITEL